MIRRLYKEYRLQIVFAFLLVIFENLAYVAEPYVFGKAIDGLREAHQVEEEVDSSLTTIQMHQIADSVRSHILDSIKIDDSLRLLDSLTSSNAGQNLEDENGGQGTYGTNRTNRTKGANMSYGSLVSLTSLRLQRP